MRQHINCKRWLQYLITNVEALKLHVTPSELNQFPSLITEFAQSKKPGNNRLRRE